MQSCSVPPWADRTFSPVLPPGSLQGILWLPERTNLEPRCRQLSCRLVSRESFWPQLKYFHHWQRRLLKWRPRRTEVKAIAQWSAFCHKLRCDFRMDAVVNLYDFTFPLCVCLRRGVSDGTGNFLLPTTSTNHTSPHCCLHHTSWPLIICQIQVCIIFCKSNEDKKTFGKRSFTKTMTSR